MSAAQISVLPTPVPSAADPTNFDTRADAFLGALPNFATEANLLSTQINNIALIIAGQYASDSASNTVGTGSKSITIDELGKTFFVGLPVVMYETANPTSKWMAGPITAFNPNTGDMTINVTSSTGSGSASGWTIASNAPLLSPISVGSVIYTRDVYSVF